MQKQILVAVVSGLIGAAVIGLVTFFLNNAREQERLEVVQREISFLRTIMDKMDSDIDGMDRSVALLEGTLKGLQVQLSAQAVSSASPNISFSAATRAIETLPAAQVNDLFENLPSLVSLPPPELEQRLENQYELALQDDGSFTAPSIRRDTIDTEIDDVIEQAP